MLEEEAYQALVSGKRRAMNDHWSLDLALFVDEGKVKTFRLSKIYLVGCQRKLTPDGRFHLHIDLRPVESRLIRLLNEGDVMLDHRAAHHVFGLEPHLGVVHIFLAQPTRVVSGQAHDVFLNTEELEIFEVEVDDPGELVLELALGTIDVRVVHLHRAHAHQAEQLARFLVAIAGSILGQAQRQVAVGTRF